MTIVCWLLTRAHRRGRTDAEAPLTRLFITWCSLFWLMIVWDVGVGRVVLGNLREDRLLLTFQIWETHSPSEHLYLAWLTREDFSRHAVYTNHLHPYLFFLYGVSKAVQLITGLPLAVGKNATAFVVSAVGVAAFAALAHRIASRGDRRWTFYATMFAALGFFVTEAHYWTYIYTTNIDSVFPLWIYCAAILWAAAEPRVTDRNGRLIVAASILFAAFGWLYTPLVMAALWCCFGSSARRTIASAPNRVLIRASAAAVLVCVFVYAIPRMLALWKGYSFSDSSFLFRSGLDGDTAYFHNPVQAVFRPYWGPARSLSDILFPAFVPLLVCGAVAMGGGRARRVRTLSGIVFLFSPYVFSLALFPQSVSVHVYLYDQLLFLPAALIGAVWSLSPRVQRRLRGPYAFAAALLGILLVTSQLVAIAQAMRGATTG